MEADAASLGRRASKLSVRQLDESWALRLEVGVLAALTEPVADVSSS